MVNFTMLHTPAVNNYETQYLECSGFTETTHPAPSLFPEGPRARKPRGGADAADPREHVQERDRLPSQSRAEASDREAGEEGSGAHACDSGDRRRG